VLYSIRWRQRVQVVSLAEAATEVAACSATTIADFAVVPICVLIYCRRQAWRVMMTAL
jgi:hypothetical protein